MSVEAVTAIMVASSPLVTIDEEAAVEKAVELMKRHQIKHLPGGQRWQTGGHSVG